MEERDKLEKEKNWDKIEYRQFFICKRKNRKTLKEIYADTGVFIWCKNFSFTDEPHCALVDGRCCYFETMV